MLRLKRNMSLDVLGLGLLYYFLYCCWGVTFPQVQILLGKGKMFRYDTIFCMLAPEI
jgi:hypothetical protein